VKKLLARCQVEGIRFRAKNDGVYTTINIRAPYTYGVAMPRRLYGDLDCVQFKEQWVPLIHTMSSKGSVFN
jgi:hypothetical protein